MDHPTLASFHFCPSCGAKALQKDLHKRIHCSNCGFHLYLNPAVAVSLVLFNEKGEVLVSTRAKDPGKNMLDLPGGFIDPYETAEKAARREIKEELGISLGDLTYIGTETNVYPYRGVTYQTVDIGYSSFIPSQTQFVIDAELIDAFWVPYKGINKEKIAFPSAFLLLQKFIQQKYQFYLEA